jgi:hypothetical protein
LVGILGVLDCRTLGNSIFRQKSFFFDFEVPSLTINSITFDKNAICLESETVTVNSVHFFRFRWIWYVFVACPTSFVTATSNSQEQRHPAPKSKPKLRVSGCRCTSAGARSITERDSRPAVVVCSLFVAATIITSYSNHVDNTNN